MTRLWAAVRAVLGVDECLLCLALGLVATGFWFAWRPGAFLVPGLILLWLVLPTRRSFVAPPDPPPARRKSNG